MAMTAAEIIAESQKRARAAERDRLQKDLDKATLQQTQSGFPNETRDRNIDYLAGRIAELTDD